jgi:hypothetical protein
MIVASFFTFCHHRSTSLCWKRFQNVQDTNPVLHNELIFLYLESITKLLRLQQEAAASQVNGRERTTVSAGLEPGRLGILRKKLINFLETSLYYAPEKMLSKFPLHELLEERAILLSRIGQHSEVTMLCCGRLALPDT